MNAEPLAVAPVRYELKVSSWQLSITDGEEANLKLVYSIGRVHVLLRIGRKICE